MPKLNLKDDSMEDEGSFEESSSAPPTLRDLGGSGGGGGISPILQVLIAIIVLGGITFALNYFGVIHLWGKKPQKVVETFDEPYYPPVDTTQYAQTETPPVNTPEVAPTQTQIEPPQQQTPPALGTGRFTIQVSAWQTKSKADQEATKLVQAGFPAFTEDGTIDGSSWHRVRVGRYDTRKQANEERERLQRMLEGEIWVAVVSER